MQPTFIVLTEEKPNIDEIRLMLEIIDYKIPTSITNLDIRPKIIGNKFEGYMILEFNHIVIHIYLCKGMTSCIDYMLFKGDFNIRSGSASEVLVLLESTKTCDIISRNTAVYQRLSKFVMYDIMYPNSSPKKIMFYCNDQWKDKLTKTAEFGMKQMISLNIDIYTYNDNKEFINLKNKYNINSFISCDEIIELKNIMKEKKGNESIRMYREENNIVISLKLDKRNCIGKISHDPNVGFLIGILNIMKDRNDIPEKYIIKNHHIDQDYFNKYPKSKLIYCLKDIPIEFENCEIKEKPIFSKPYFKIDTISEKVASILYELILPYPIFFSNHGGCALTDMKGHDKIEKVGKNMHRPDLCYIKEETNEIFIIEGKKEKEISKGIKQLSNEYLENFIKKCLEYIQNT